METAKSFKIEVTNNGGQDDPSVVLFSYQNYSPSELSSILAAFFNKEKGLAVLLLTAIEAAKEN
jgi:hypothetical protein